jgi:hypothetical protein
VVVCCDRTANEFAEAQYQRGQALLRTPQQPRATGCQDHAAEVASDRFRQAYLTMVRSAGAAPVRSAGAAPTQQFSSEASRPSGPPGQHYHCDLPYFGSTLAPRTMITVSFADWSLSAGFTAVSWSLISRDNGPILVRRGVS